MTRWPLILAALLAGCAAPVPVPAPRPALAAGDACGASAQAGRVGQDATALERVLILREVRVIRPGQPVTEDLRPTRLNFEIGPEGRIARVFCG